MPGFAGKYAIRTRAVSFHSWPLHTCIKMEFIRKIVFAVVGVQILITLNVQCSIAAGPEHHRMTGLIPHHTESPLDEETTISNDLGFKETLDTIHDANGNWTIPRSIKKWFEYYNSTADLKESANDSSKCPHVMSADIINLQDVDGIWAACHDPVLPRECFITSRNPCHPFLSYSFTSQLLPRLRTVKINLLLRGLAVVRFSINQRDKPCFDFSARNDPFSLCQHIQVNSSRAFGWTQVETPFDFHDDAFFSKFTIELIARFESDVALVEKIEATDYITCDDDILCTTTIGPPTRTTTTITTTTTEGGFPKSTLESEQDAEMDRKWEMSSLSPRHLEYYSDSAELVSQEGDQSSCASIISSTVNGLPIVEGLWSSCPHPNLFRKCSQEATNSSCHPFIRYSLEEDQLVISVNIKFYLQATAVLRLYLGSNCFDYSVEEIDSSPCSFMQLLDDGIYWRGLHKDAGPNIEFHGFRVELISRHASDVALVDRIKVEYRQCANGKCFQQTTVTPTTEQTTPTDGDKDGSSVTTDAPETSASTDSGTETPKPTDTSTTEGYASSTGTEFASEVPKSSVTTDKGTEVSEISNSWTTDALTQSTSPKGTESGSCLATSNISFVLFLFMIIYQLQNN